MGRIADIFFGARLEDGKLIGDAKKAGGKAGDAAGKSFLSRMGRAFKTGAGIGATIAGFNILGNAIGSVTSALADARVAYQEDQASQAKLRASLKANVAAYDGNTDAIEDVLAQRIKLGFSDDEQRESLSTLLTRTHDVTKALQLQRVAMDLARLRGIDLGAATDLLGKAFSGQVGALRKAGIAVDKNATATEALVAVQKAAAGQAEAFADTEEGRVVVANARAAEASEKFGKALSKIEVAAKELAIGPLELLADAIEKNGEIDEAYTKAAERLREQGIQPTTENVKELARQFMRGSVDARLFGKTLKGEVIPNTDDAAGAADDLAGVLDDELPDAAKESRDSLKDLGDEAREARDRITDLADAIVESLYGDTIRAGKEADLKGRIAELNKELNDTETGKRRAAELRGEIAELRGQLFLLHLEQAETEGPQAVLDFLDREYAKTDKTDQKTRDLIASLQAVYSKAKLLSQVTFAGGGLIFTGIPTTPRATGGPVEPGQVYRVGERRAETLVMDEHGGGYIYPDATTTSGSRAGSTIGGGTVATGGDTYVNVSLPGLLRAESPADVARTLRHLNVNGTFREKR